MTEQKTDPKIVKAAIMEGLQSIRTGQAPTYLVRAQMKWACWSQTEMGWDQLVLKGCAST